VLRFAIWTIRQPRYAALAALMVVIAIGCIGAGTWQISRFEQSVRANDALKANAHAASVPLSPALVPLVGSGPGPTDRQIRFRTVSVTGTYVTGSQQFLRNETRHGNIGFYAVNQLRSTDATVLVVRGFIAANSADAPPASITPPPTGPVTITGRLETTDSRNDAAGQAADSQIESINPTEQAARLRTPVYDAYLTLNPGQPGSRGVDVLGSPDLSNPAGGAYEWQHFAYIVQWYLFAALALIAPFAIGRSEIREARERFLGIAPSAEDEPLELGSGESAELALRANGALARPGETPTQQYQRAVRLADRYGRSLGVGSTAPQAGDVPRGRVTPTRGDEDEVRVVANSAAHPHRSEDDGYHGSYNDYLWQLGLADGATPPVESAEDDASAD
jgi:cytochrome oxidase assembly protein ShyY1